MANYLVEIEPQFDLPQIGMQIESEELGYSELVGIQIGHHGNKVTNLATFKELPTGTTPKPGELVEAKPGEPPPAGKVVAWSGPMLAANRAVYAALIRGT